MPVPGERTEDLQFCFSVGVTAMRPHESHIAITEQLFKTNEQIRPICSLLNVPVFTFCHNG
jgi:hypothetical protein